MFGKLVIERSGVGLRIGAASAPTVKEAAHVSPRSFRNAERSKSGDEPDDAPDGLPASVLWDQIADLAEGVVLARRPGEFCCPSCFLIKRDHLRQPNGDCIDCDDAPVRLYPAPAFVAQLIGRLCADCASDFVPLDAMLCESCRDDRRVKRLAAA